MRIKKLIRINKKQLMAEYDLNKLKVYNCGCLCEINRLRIYADKNNLDDIYKFAMQVKDIIIEIGAERDRYCCSNIYDIDLKSEELPTFEFIQSSPDILCEIV